VVAPGDSGNDILMLEGDNLAIVVGNVQVCLGGVGFNVDQDVAPGTHKHCMLIQ
jgi:hypothetical protein